MVILKYLSKIDFFGEPIQFCLKMKHYQTSAFSGFLTLIFIGTFISIAFEGFLDLVLRSNITSYTTDIYNLSPPFINFTQYNMKFAFTLSDPTLNDARYFKIELNQYRVKHDESGNSKKLKFPAQLGPCDINDFDEKLHITLQTLPVNFSNLLCPLNHQDFYIQGKFSGHFFDYISLKISKCQNTDTLTCASDNEINRILLKNENKIYFNIYFSNNIIDINNINNYLTRFLDDRIYVLLDLNFYKEKNVYFTSNDVFTDASIFQQGYTDQLTTYTFENNYDETSISLNTNDLFTTTIYLRSNFLSKKQIRTVEKITDYLGYIGGFWSGLYMIFSRIGKRHNRSKFMLKIAKKLYCFPPQMKKFSNKSSTIMDFKDKFLIKNDRRKALGFTGSRDSSDNTKDDSKKPFKKLIEEYIAHNQATQLFTKARNFFSKKLSISLLIKNYKLEKILEKKALLTIEKDIDIVHLLGKIKEIDKLKSIFLDNNQKNLFEYLPKSKIRLENDNHFLSNRSSMLFMLKTHKGNNEKTKQDFQLNDFYILYKSYKIMLEDVDPKSIEINSKIIKTLEPDLLEIFKRENEKSKEKSKMENSLTN